MIRASAWTLLLGVAAAAGQTGGNEAILESARRVALSYARNLPNFVCMERVRRLADWKKQGDWVPLDNLTLQLTYQGLKENYQLIGKDGKPSRKKLDALAGAFSQGEFGSVLRLIFEAESRAEFQWERWDLSGIRGLAVFSYRVRAANSRYALVALTRSEVVGFHGEIAIEPQSGRTMRWTVAAEPPADFPIMESVTTLEYGLRDIGGAEYLLPVRAEVISAERSPAPEVLRRMPAWKREAVGLHYRNIIEFRDYRKFEADARIVFQ
jgi:hypothetical protein